MKKLYSVIKINLIAVTFICMGQAQAKDSVVGTISEVRGKVFISRLGKLKQATVSEKIYDNSEIITELSSQVTLTDYYDHRFHVSGGSHLRMADNQIELLRGYVWLQSFDPKMISEISTANARVYFKQAEAIISYDQSIGKTQTAVISGRVQLTHSLESFRATIIDEGKFSFISNEIDNGTPRNPTVIGQTSFEKMAELFNGVKPLDSNNAIALENKKATINRAPASVTVELENDILAVKKKAPTAKAVETNDSNQLLIDYYKDKIAELEGKQVRKRPVANRAPASVTPKKVESTPVKFKIYGATNNEVASAPVAPKRKPSAVNRAPASVGNMGSLSPSVNPDVFERRLNDEYSRQTRHNQETLKLIDELKNYKVDFRKSY